MNDPRVEGTRFYTSLFISTGAASLLACAAGERLLRRASTVSHVVLTGAFFGLFTLLVCAAAILCEMIFKRLSSYGDGRSRQNALRMTALATAAACLLGGAFQFLYEYERAAQPVPVENYAIIVDNSQSMETNDRVKFRFSAIASLADKLPADAPVAVYIFGSEPLQVRDFIARGEKPFEVEDEWRVGMGGTNIRMAVSRCCDDLTAAKAAGRLRGRTRLFLLTDGCCQEMSGHILSGVGALASKAVDCGCEIESIGFGQPDKYLLSRLSSLTGGKYYSSDSVENIDMMLTLALNTSATADRLLTDVRTGAKSGSALYGVMRAVFLFVLFCVTSLTAAYSVAGMNKFERLKRKAVIASAAAAVLAELLFQNTFLYGGIIRAAACLIVGTVAVSTFFTRRKRRAFVGIWQRYRWRYREGSHTVRVDRRIRPILRR